MNAKRTALAAAVAVALAIGAYLVLRPRPEHPLPPPAPPEAEQRPADAPLPPPAASDAKLRTDFSSVSPKLSDWLSQPDLLDRIAAALGALVRDESPRKPLDFLAPKGRFSTVSGHIDPKSYERYDGIADVVASADAHRLAAAIKAAHPLLESAYHRLADPNRSFDDALKAALQRIAAAPVVEGDIAVVPHGGIDLFADEKLEVLGPIEKHLIRMGPKNEKVIQSKARELLSAL
jgi:hypothetical protein